jgi:hypothetical protein
MDIYLFINNEKNILFRLLVSFTVVKKNGIKHTRLRYRTIMITIRCSKKFIVINVVKFLNRCVVKVF